MVSQPRTQAMVGFQAPGATPCALWMKIRDNEFAVVNVRLRLRGLSADELEAIALAVRGEEASRRCRLSTASEILPAMRHQETLAADLGNIERWTSVSVEVIRQWQGYDSPWTCSPCGEEWCRVRNPPPRGR